MRRLIGRSFANLRVLSAALWLGLLLAPLAPFSLAHAEGQGEAQVLDYEAWEKVASRAEERIVQDQLDEKVLDALREELVTWRGDFSTAQNTNSTRIATVREQLAALGPAPEGEASEPPEIAAKRKELNDQLTKLSAPGIAADEAYRRADGMIREIDRELRDRQADRLLQLWPSPINPANWPEAAYGISGTIMVVWNELQAGWNTPRAKARLFDNLPLILLLLAVAVATTVFARAWIAAFAERLQTGKTQARRRIFALIASLGQVIVPTIGMIALSAALTRTGLMGRISGPIAQALPFLGFFPFMAIWLGGRAFPKQQIETATLPLVPEHRAEGRLLATLMGVVLALEGIRALTMERQDFSEAVISVASFPIIAFAGFLLWRMGRLLYRSPSTSEETASYGRKLLGLMGRALTVIGVVGPVMAAFGYVLAGRALVFPAIMSLGLLTLLLILQRLLSDLWAVIYPDPNDESGTEGLVPVLLGFALALCSLPLFAIIWGTRISELTEVWARFREGFQLGETRISPTDFLVFGVIFAVGYLITRLFQGALRNSILPRTKMDRGGQNALVSGAGYVGIFLAALVAINATGIDLSGLAIVASALSVGIGFGLQNIVQNFVSGIILMIERPVSEGDWIAVGTTEGIVKTISVRSTRIQTFDRNVVVVPNADLVSQRVTNWTRFGLAGRLIVPVSVAWGEDTRRVEQLLREVAEAQPMVVLNPPPAILLQSFGGGQVHFEIRVILRDVNFGSSVRNDINHELVRRFTEEKIPLTTASSPQYILREGSMEAGGAVPLAATEPEVKPVASPSGRLEGKSGGPQSEETT